MTRSIGQFRPSTLYIAMVLALPMATAMAGKVRDDTPPVPLGLSWKAVANNGTDIPKSNPVAKFSSFNQPSVNSVGLVVMRARGKGGTGGESLLKVEGGQPLRGVYTRQMGGVPGPVVAAFDALTTVPQPNNTFYQDQLGTFTEFPAFPRIGLTESTIATRGQSKPLWTYTPDGQTEETKVGTSGVYVANLAKRASAATQLGVAPGFAYYSVPGAPPGTKFDQFPGAPAVADKTTVVFKGNYTDVVSKTGIFFSKFNFTDPTQRTVKVIASSNTLIPGQTAVRFGSTAPPSASPLDAVFLGLDNEEAPTLGAIYRAPLASNPKLQTLVSIGSQVPGELNGMTFNRLGEGLSYDGRFVAFWGAWGDETRTVTLTCPVDGNAAIIAECNRQYPGGQTTVQVPTNQGFFVHDAKTLTTYPIVRTSIVYKDFMYWTFSGRPPGVGDSESEDFELPRWRSSAFAATYGPAGNPQVAFKGRRTTDVDGIYLTTATTPIRTIVETGMDGAVLDPAAAGIPVTSVGLERDGLRNGWLAIAASMTNGVDSWAGVYVARTSR